MPAIIDIKKIVESAGGEESFDLRLRHFEDDVRYLQSVRPDLLRKHLDQWVAIFDKSIVGYGKSASELRRKLTLKGIPQNEAVVDFIASERKAMLL